MALADPGGYGLAFKWWVVILALAIWGRGGWDHQLTND